MSTRAAYREPGKSRRNKLPRGAGYLPKWWLDEVPHSVLEDDAEHEKRITAIVLEQRQEHTEDDVELLLRQSISSEDILQDLKDTEHSTSSLQYEVLPEEGTSHKMKPMVVGSAAVIFTDDSPKPTNKESQTAQPFHTESSGGADAFGDTGLRVETLSTVENPASTGGDATTQFSTVNGNASKLTSSAAVAARGDSAAVAASTTEKVDGGKPREAARRVSLVTSDESAGDIDIRINETLSMDPSEPDASNPFLDETGSPSFEQAWGQSTSDEEQATPTHQHEGHYDSNPFTVIRSSEENIEVAVTFTGTHLERERSTDVAGGQDSGKAIATFTNNENQVHRESEVDGTIAQTSFPQHDGNRVVAYGSTCITDEFEEDDADATREQGIHTEGQSEQFSSEEKAESVDARDEFNRDTGAAAGSVACDVQNGASNGFSHDRDEPAPVYFDPTGSPNDAPAHAPPHAQYDTFEGENGEIPSTDGPYRQQQSIYLPEEPEMEREHVGPENLRHVEFQRRTAPERDPTMVVGPHLLRRAGTKHREAEDEQLKTNSPINCHPQHPEAMVGGDNSISANNHPSESQPDSAAGHHRRYVSKGQEPKARKYKTAFTGVSPFDFAMQQRAKEKERKEKERLAKQALSRHHATSVQVDKVVERKQKDLEERQRKMETEQAMKTHHATSVQGDEAQKQKQKEQEQRQKKVDAERALHAFRERDLPDRKK